MLTWFKSSHSDENEACVEVALPPDGSVSVRDSKIGDTSPVLTFTADQWRTFLADARL